MKPDPKSHLLKLSKANKPSLFVNQGQEELLHVQDQEGQP